MHRRRNQSKRIRILGGLSTLIVVLAACDDKPGSSSDAAVVGRSESVTASAGMPTLASTTPIVSHSAPTPASPPRKLCDGQLGQPGRKLPTTKFTPVGHPTLSDKLPASNGRWTWINFFAAWCGPCKEEMPRLREMEKKLSSNLVVAFVSVDDDQRQLDQFLETQGATGVRAALWVEPNKQRDTWLTGLKMKNPPDLPAHVLVDPSGKIRCVTGGAIEDADFAAISAIVKM